MKQKPEFQRIGILPWYYISPTYRPLGLGLHSTMPCWQEGVGGCQAGPAGHATTWYMSSMFTPQGLVSLSVVKYFTALPSSPQRAPNPSSLGTTPTCSPLKSLGLCIIRCYELHFRTYGGKTWQLANMAVINLK